MLGALLCLLFSGLLSGPVAWAADDALTWSVRPADNDNGADRPNFAYQADPGQVVHDVIVVTNGGDETLTLQIYAADAFTGPSGLLDLLPGGGVSTDVGAWVRLDTDELVLEPGAAQEVPFTVTVPTDARPGDHSGGIVTSYVDDRTSTTVRVDNRLGSRMHVRVSGDLEPAVEVSDVQVDYSDNLNPFGASTATVRYTVENTGNTRVTATELVRVVGPLGWGASSVRPAGSDGADPADGPVTGPVDLPELLPGSTLDRAVTITGVWPLVRVTAEVTVVPSAVGIGATSLDPVERSASTWAVPWTLLAAVVLVVVVALRVPALLAARSGRRAEPDAVPAPTTPSVGVGEHGRCRGGCGCGAGSGGW